MNRLQELEAKIDTHLFNSDEDHKKKVIAGVGAGAAGAAAGVGLANTGKKAFKRSKLLVKSPIARENVRRDIKIAGEVSADKVRAAGKSVKRTVDRGVRTATVAVKKANPKRIAKLDMKMVRRARKLSKSFHANQTDRMTNLESKLDIALDL